MSHTELLSLLIKADTFVYHTFAKQKGRLLFALIKFLKLISNIHQASYNSTPNHLYFVVNF